jgi:hypothetical protein
MWMVDPKIMCLKHLLGEHVELHMLVGTIRQGKSLSGYARNGLVETSKIADRHRALVIEMTARGIRHRSTLRYTDKLNIGKVDRTAAKKELLRRCPACRQRAYK